MSDISFTIQNDGSLKITADAEAREELKAAYADGGYPRAFDDILEAGLRSGFERIRPEYIGALTDSPIFGEEVTYEDDLTQRVEGRVWWFPEYQVINEVEELIQKGEVTFTLASEYEPEQGTSATP